MEKDHSEYSQSQLIKENQDLSKKVYEYRQVIVYLHSYLNYSIAFALCTGFILTGYLLRKQIGYSNYMAVFLLSGAVSVIISVIVLVKELARNRKGGAIEKYVNNLNRPFDAFGKRQSSW